MLGPESRLVLTRHLQDRLEEALADTPVVMLTGARQTGKTTLVQALAAARSGMRTFTLDDESVRAAASADPQGFVAALGSAAAIDEVQKAPALLPAIKASVDRDRRAGRFLLTGSANVLLLPRVSESLVGRMEVATLWPFSQGEILGRRETFVDDLLAGRLPASTASRATDLVRSVTRGGYPEAVRRARSDRRRAFFDAYVTTLLSRDVRDLAGIEDLAALRQLLRLAAVRSGSILNHSELARTLGIPVSTAKRYLAVLELLFVVHLVPAWARNRSKRLVRAPKLHLADTGLLCSLSGLEEDALRADRTFLGPLLESFVAAELVKQSSWSEARPSLYHFRTHGGHEVDLVLEDAQGRLAGIQVKAGATVGAGDFTGLRTLSELAGGAFVQGAVLYGGRETIPFGPRLAAWPIESLWTGP